MRRLREENQRSQMEILESNKRMHEESSLSIKQKKKAPAEKRAQQPRNPGQKSFGEDLDIDPKLRISGEIKKDTIGDFKIYRSRYSGRVRDHRRDKQNLMHAVQQHAMIVDHMEDSEGKNRSIKVDFGAFTRSLNLDEMTAKHLEQNFKDMERGMLGHEIDQVIAFHKQNYKNYVASRPG